MTIDGTGKSITVSANNAVQVMLVSAGKMLNLFALTITDGHCDSPCSGGAILNVGTLKVTGSTFSGNSALLGGAIHNFGRLEVTGSTFSRNSARIGGAIHNFDTLTISGSTFSGNSATSFGGAIHNFDTMTIVDSTFSGNSATTSDDISNGNQGAPMTVNSSNVACTRVGCFGFAEAFQSFPNGV